jgi:hypothetical protein
MLDATSGGVVQNPASSIADYPTQFTRWITQFAIGEIDSVILFILPTPDLARLPLARVRRQ